MNEKMEDMKDANKKDDHHIIINAYLDNEIIGDSATFAFFGLLTLFFIVQKLNDNLMAKWNDTFYPVYIYLVYKFLRTFWKIIRTESSESDGNGGESTNSTKILKIENFEQIVLISNFFGMIQYALGFLTFYYLGCFLDLRKDEYLLSSLYLLASLCASQLIYSLFRNTSLFKIKRNNPDLNPSKASRLAFITSITAPLLTYLSNMMIVCSSSSGVCTQIYMSTIASLLGAFGVTLSDFSDYLFPVTVILLGVSLFSLYIKRKKLTHPPFLLGVFSSIMIILAHIFENTHVYYLIYPGNVLMIISAIWNARMNKFYGLPRYSK